MKKELLKNVLPLNLQFFAEPNDDPDDEPTDDPKGGDDEGGDLGKPRKERTFTQKEVSAMMAKEKKQGRRAVLNSLGFETEEDAKSAFSLLKALTDSQKTGEEKEKDKKDEAVKEKGKAEQRAIQAENKLACFMAGVNKDSIDDVLAIASAKLDEDNDLSDVLEDMKKKAKYASFFKDSDEDEEDDDKPENKGTGSKPRNGKTKKEEPGSFGKRLAEASNSQKKKSSYF